MDQESLPDDKTILLLEPFYGGSHKQLLDILEENIPGCAKVCMTDKKWHWRMRTSGLHFSEVIPLKHNLKLLFVTAVINLAELLALRPELAKLKKILYFHENQLIYPVRKQQDRDFQYGYNQILSCLVADVVVFNSLYNQESFLGSINSFLNLMPDYKPKGLPERIRPKCTVLYFPLINIDFDAYSEENSRKTITLEKDGPLHIVWAHRWEHDKDPSTFFDTLLKLTESGAHFKVSVIGQRFSDVPDVFEKAKSALAGHILHWGFQETKQQYRKVLREADVAISTAVHEFFGVSMLEAVSCGCYPMCPNRLVYPEFFPDEYLYNTPQQLFKKLKYFCKKPEIPRRNNIQIDIHKYSWKYLKSGYEELLLDTSKTEI